VKVCRASGGSAYSAASGIGIRRSAAYLSGVMFAIGEEVRFLRSNVTVKKEL
jgi:hypothetical protein